MAIKCSNIRVICALKRLGDVESGKPAYFGFNFCVNVNETIETIKLIRDTADLLNLPLERVDVVGFSELEEDKLNTQEYIKTSIVESADFIKERANDYAHSLKKDFR